MKRLLTPFARSVTTTAATALASVTLVLGARAQIESLTLAQMVQKADHAIIGEVVDRRVYRVDHPVDGARLYFTEMTIRGTSLYDGRTMTLPVTFMGGFVSPDDGVYNSEAPTYDETKLGSKVVAFYKWTDNMGGDVAANALYAAHGGLFRVVSGRSDRVVLGRGEGYAITSNVQLATLQASVRQHL